MDEELIARLETGATLITATRRLGRAVEAGFARVQQDRGARVWATPAIFSYEAWLARLWAEAEDLGLAQQRLLDALFERMQWEKYLQADRAVAGLFDKKVAAAQAQDAYGLLRQQGKTLGQLPPYLSFDARAFSEWAREFERDCAVNKWLPAAALEWTLSDLIAGGDLPVAGPVIFHGFDQFTPAQSRLQASLDGAHVQWDCVATAARPVGQAGLFAAADPQAEITAAARWARHYCDRNPGARVGVVVLDLDQRRRMVERVFRDAFTPGPLWHGAAFGDRVNISLGQRLIDLPPVREAVWLLELCFGDVPWQRVSALIRSPFFFVGPADHPATLSERALREVTFRDYALAAVGLPALIHWESKTNQRDETQENLPWSKVHDLVKLWPTRATPRRWREHIDAVLACCGWMKGPDALYSGQVRQAWGEVADRLSGLDGWLNDIDVDEAVARLKQLLTEQITQEETSFAPVQVLGGLEAGGLAFDAVWVAGARDDLLPTPVHPNPFLPAQWQRREGFPRADPRLEQDYGRRRVEGFLAMGSEVVFSYGQTDGDQHFGPSPLLRAIPPLNEPVGVAANGQSWHEQLFNSAPLENYQDEQGPPLALGGILAGGTSMIKAQSVCPFQGFARAQLAAEPLSETCEGFDAAERGTLVHEVLRIVWSRVKTQADLLALEQERLHGVIEAAASQAVDGVLRKTKRLLTHQVVYLERLRLTALVKNWLAFEATRPPFVVHALEQGRTVRIGPLELRTRVDRIDALVNGERLIIDYKTGQPKVQSWFGQRPDEPQLPLYAVTGEEPVDGLLFGQIRPGDMRMIGLTSVSDCAPGARLYSDSEYCHGMTWSAQLNEWRSRLETIAVELAEGIARVAPKEGAKTCSQCQRMALCRVFEVIAVQDTAAEEDDESDALA